MVAWPGEHAESISLKIRHSFFKRPLSQNAQRACRPNSLCRRVWTAKALRTFALGHPGGARLSSSYLDGCPGMPSTHFSWNNVSTIAGFTDSNCLFRLHDGSIKKEQPVEFSRPPAPSPQALRTMQMTGAVFATSTTLSLQSTSTAAASPLPLQPLITRKPGNFLL